TPVEQHEVPVRTEPAQADHARTRRSGCAHQVAAGTLTIRLELRRGRHELRQLVDDALDRNRARLFESRGLDRHDRAARFEVPAYDAGAGDENFLDLALLRIGRLCRTERDGDCRSHSGKPQTVHGWTLFHNVLLPKGSLEYLGRPQEKPPARNCPGRGFYHIFIQSYNCPAATISLHTLRPAGGISWALG